MNFKINKGVLWLKVGYSLWAMATAMVMPFIALQMSSKGLSDGDISLILGVMPFSLVFIMPFIGKYRIIDSNKNVFLILTFISCRLDCFRRIKKKIHKYQP